MSVIPIAFAFDQNFVFPASICLYSLLENAQKDTFYDIFIIHPESNSIAKAPFDTLQQKFSNCSIKYRSIGEAFNTAFEIRGITISTYYRLLIPEIIPEYDKILYSDVDVIFRSDLSEFYNQNIGEYYFGAVNAMADQNVDLNNYYNKLGLDSKNIYYAGNLIINSALIRKDNKCEEFKSLVHNKYKFQDLDVINISCANKIYSLPPSFCVTTYFSLLASDNREPLYRLWPDSEIENARINGIIHYNGQKPWKGLCPNFDIWWEYYRRSPFFDEKYYFYFFYNKLDEFDQLSLLKRIKILIRYFVYGRKTPIQ